MPARIWLMHTRKLVAAVARVLLQCMSDSKTACVYACNTPSAMHNESLVLNMPGNRSMAGTADPLSTLPSCVHALIKLHPRQGFAS
jgi:hypothetical protein